MNILSINSHVAYGHVGNSAVVLPLQRLGHEVWPVHTVMLSNHAGYRDVGGRHVPADELGAAIGALQRGGMLARCDGVLSGYICDSASGAVVLDAVGKVRARNSDVLYCCDPVMGDDGAAYVGGDIIEFMHDRALPAADIATPNLFELSLLAGMAPPALSQGPLDATIAAARALLVDRRTSVVLVTSLSHHALPPDRVAMAAITETAGWIVSTPKLALAPSVHGAGDSCAALFAAALMAGAAVPDALSSSASAIFALLEMTAKRNESELALVAAQDAMLSPAKIFCAESLA